MVKFRSGSMELITVELQFWNPLSDSYNLSILKTSINCCVYTTRLNINSTSIYEIILEQTLCPHQYLIATIL